MRQLGNKSFAESIKTKIDNYVWFYQVTVCKMFTMSTWRFGIPLTKID